MNQCTFIGRFTHVPELKEIVKEDGKNTCVSNFTLAIERKFKKSNNSIGKQTSYLNFEIWDLGAKTVVNNFDKGDYILVNCSARNDNYEDETGKKIHKIKFRVENFAFLPYHRSDTEKVEK